LSCQNKNRVNLCFNVIQLFCPSVIIQEVALPRTVYLMLIIYGTNPNAKNKEQFPEWCRQQGFDVIELIQIDQLNKVERKPAGILISDRTGFIYPEEFLREIDFPAVNVHPSLLPFHKGAHPIFWSCLFNSKWGVSIHEMEKCVDSGALMMQQEIEYNEKMTFQNVYDLYRTHAFIMMQKLVKELSSSGTIAKENQSRIAVGSHKLANALPLISKLRKKWDTPIDEARITLEPYLKEIHYPGINHFEK
jgi:hypothetical protein